MVDWWPGHQEMNVTERTGRSTPEDGTVSKPEGGGGKERERGQSFELTVILLARQR